MIKNKNQGITLIALVITIIILLILASISIATLTGQNGILSKATKANNEYKKETAREKIQLAILSYQVNKESTTVYDELIKIEGLTSITPNDRNDGPPYTVIVDGYEFIVKEDLRIEFVQEKEDSNLYIPEITEVNYPKEEVENLTLTIKAKTEDNAGLKEIIVSYKKTEGEAVQYETIKIESVSGKEVQVEIQVPINGNYVIQAIGQNNKIGKKEITISNIKEGSVLASITVGNLLTNNQPNANVIIRAETQRTAIQKMELYVAGEKVKTYDYSPETKTQIEETYLVENMEFYKELACYAKVFSSNQKETDSEEVTIVNNKIIATATDLKNLATQVNTKDNTFQDKTILVINDITAEANWVPIGYWDGQADWTGKYFAGTLEGNNHTITISSLSKDTKYCSSGLFGMIIGGTINNITVNGTMDVSCEYIGGITGGIKDGTIFNCKNSSNITDTSYAHHGGIVGYAEKSFQIINCSNTGTIYGKSTLGGIVANVNTNSSNNKTILNCSNSGLVKCYGTEEIAIPGETTKRRLCDCRRDCWKIKWNN